MSAKLVPPATSPSMANLASKVISRLANHHHMGDDNESESDITTTTTATTTATATSTTTATSQSNQDDEDEDEDAGIIRCICNYTDDDGFTIQCEHCLVWQHAVCVGIVQSNVPDRYLCEQCSPRPVDRKRANEVQRRRIGALDRKREKTPPPPPSRRKAVSVFLCSLFSCVFVFLCFPLLVIKTRNCSRCVLRDEIDTFCLKSPFCPWPIISCCPFSV